MKIVKWLDENMEQVLLCAFLSVMAVIMGIQIVCRYLFNNSLTWSEELTRCMFVWSTFLSISYCIRKDISISIDMFVKMLPAKGFLAIRILTEVIMLAFFAYLLPYAFEFLITTHQDGQLSPAMEIPMVLIYSSPFIGCVLTEVRLVQAIATDVKKLFGKTDSIHPVHAE